MLASSPPRPEPGRRAGEVRPVPERSDELSRRFFAAGEGGDIEGLVALLAADAVRTATAAATPRPWRVPFTAPTVWRARSAPGCEVARRADISWERAEVNGQPGALARDSEDRVLSVLLPRCR